MRINVYGDIIRNDDKWVYDWFEYDSTCPKDVAEKIEKANGEKLDIYINSGGGDVVAGSEIYSAIREYQGDVLIHITGLAASAASVIAMAGRSTMSPTAQIMVHNVSSQTHGNYHDMDKMSEILQNANQAIASAYVAKSGMSMNDALALMDNETWLTAEKAKELGLIDDISENQNLRLAATSGMSIPPAIIDKLKSLRAEREMQEQFDELKNGGIKNEF